MATLSQLVDRTRMELADTPKLFTQTIRTTGDTQVYELSYAPVLATSCTVYLDGIEVPDDPEDGVEYSGVQIEESTGKIIFDFYPAAEMNLYVTGTHFRYFTDDEITTIVQSAFDMHVKGRSDTYGRKITVENLDPIEDYPVALLSTIQAVQVLMTDAAFDIDIYAPDGINIPRSQRFRQLEEMLANLKDRYRDLCMALNIGMYKVEVFTLRRISARTNRYVPIYRPREIDDRSRPERVYLPIPTYGGELPAPATAQYDLSLMQGDTFSQTFDFDIDLTGYEVKAQVRTWPEAQALAAEFTCTVTNAATGTVVLSLTPEQSERIPRRAFWDMQISKDGDVYTVVQGGVYGSREVTRTGVSSPERIGP